MKRLALRLLAVLMLSAGVLALADQASRRYVADRLGEQLEASGVSPQKLAPELAKVGGDGIEPLAEAAASTDRATARAARREIDRQVRRWAQAEVERPGVDQTAERSRLAKALLARSHRFSPSGQQWLASVATKLLTTSRSGSGGATLVTDCDRLLKESRRRSTVLDAVEPPPVIEGPRFAVAAEPALRRRLRVGPSLPASAASPTPPSTPSALPRKFQDAIAAIRDTTPQASPQPAEPRIEAVQSNPPGPTAPPTPLPPHLTPSPMPPAVSAFVPPRDARPLPWQDPKGTPTTASGPRGLRPIGATSLRATQGVGFHLTTVAALPDRWLLPKALATDSVIERMMLRRRGFGAATRRQLAAAVAPEEPTRHALALDLVAGRSGAAARLLLLLASDESPRVRRLAIEALAQSGSQVLAEAAWRMAVRDPDPAVAELADRIGRR